MKLKQAVRDTMGQEGFDPDYWTGANDNNEEEIEDNPDAIITASTSVQQENYLNVDFNKHPQLKSYCKKLKELLNHNMEQCRHACNMLEWNIVDYELFSKTIWPDKILLKSSNISVPRFNINGTLALLKQKDQRIYTLIKIIRSLLEKNKIKDYSEWFDWLFKRHTSANYYDIDVGTVVKAILTVMLYLPPTHVDESGSNAKMALWAEIFSTIFNLHLDRELAPIWEITHSIPGYIKEGPFISDFTAVITNQDGSWQYPFLLAEFASENAAKHKIVTIYKAAYELNRILLSVHNLTEREVNKTRLHVATASGTTVCFDTITPVFREQDSALIYVYKHEHTFKLRQSDMESSVEDALRLITYLRETVRADGLWIKSILNRNHKASNTVSKLQDALPRLFFKTNE
ncbi:hypothetical protein RclHR1_04790003 [Rhizophagus clarus]|uniref:Uncharacterized protein n=1 Tax=Rhizophagus clarus TaxID=94130 RepID=A0A2Z6RKB7_9GLOM|nr:hypothetical protein RclHR1_04790003 [Rhizophagus clarus]GES95895.1 hypothetical protein GLOIN_2v1543548 [Rhizophagus clarus]